MAYDYDASAAAWDNWAPSTPSYAPETSIYNWQAPSYQPSQFASTPYSGGSYPSGLKSPTDTGYSGTRSGMGSFWNPYTSQFESLPKNYTGSGTDYQQLMTGMQGYVDPAGAVSQGTNWEPGYTPTYAPETNIYDWQSPKYAPSQFAQTPFTNEFTGALGGTLYANQPQLNGYGTNPVQNNTFTQTIADWTKGISSIWDNLISPQTAQKGFQPLWEPQQVGALGGGELPFDKGSFGEGGMSGGFKVSKPFQPTEGFGTSTKVVEDSLSPYVTPTERQNRIKNVFEQGTPEGIGTLLNEINRKGTGSKPLIIGNKEAINYLQAMLPKTGSEETLMAVIGAAIKRDIPLNVPPAQLDSIKDGRTLVQLYDSGYKAPKVITAIQQGFTSAVHQASEIVGKDISPYTKFTAAQLLGMKSADIENAMDELKNITKKEWQAIIESKGEVKLNTKVTGYDVFNKPILGFQGWSLMAGILTKEEKKVAKKTADEEARQAEKEVYWSQEEVADRNARRQESADWSKAQSLEGWKEFYAVFDKLKLSPPMDNYFNNPTMFAELRRMWETSGGGQSWEAWLSSYDFEGEFGKLTPPQRGERPAAFAPRMKTVSKG
jgi:hypothetical protein